MKERSETEKPLLLVFPFGLLSHYLRCLVLARYFRPYFDIRFVYDGRYAAFIDQEGFDTFECLSFDADTIIKLVSTFDFSWLNEKALEPVYENQVKVISTLKPAAVLGDNSPTLKMAAEKTGVTCIALMNGYMSKYYAHVRRMSTTHPLYKYLHPLPANMVELLTKAGETVSFYQIHSPFKKIRSRHGLSKKYYYLDELEGDINLICDLSALFPQKKLPGNYFSIAPLYYDQPTVAGSFDSIPDQHKKTLFVSMGSSGNWEKVAFLNDSCFARYNIITAGDRHNVLHAAHFIKKDFIHVHEIFPATDLVICHGGNGTLYQALFYGIPVLCKTNHFEQEWNVDALERVQAGRSIDAVTGSAEHLSVIEDWINRKQTHNHTYRTMIQRMRATLQQTAAGIAMNILSPPIHHSLMTG